MKSVKIGEQEWMVDNLNVDLYRNGDPIPEVQDIESWKTLTSGAWCYYENISENGSKFGKLYNWFAVNDPRGLAPEGWCIPNNEDIDLLIKHFGRDYFANANLKSTQGWERGGNGNNDSGFSGLPGGYFNSSIKKFENLGLNSNWWLTAECSFDDKRACLWGLAYDDEVYQYNYNKSDGMSVRCIKEIR